MDTTWRKTYRKTLENAVVRRFGANAIGVLTWMILQADDEGRVTFTTRDAAKELKLSHKTFRNVLKAFREEGTVDVDGGRWSTAATLVKWREYQPKGTEVAQKGHGKGTTNTVQINDLNAKSAQKGHGKGTEVAQPTQETQIPPHTPLYRIREDSPSPLPPCGGSAGGARGAGMGKKEYPESPEEVVAAARDGGYVISPDTARQWLQMKRRSDWSDSSGVRITSWRRMLLGWCSSEGARTVAAEQEDEARRRREYEEVHRKSLEVIAKYEKETRR